MIHKFKIGDMVKVNLGNMRDQHYQSPSGGSSTLNGLLPDGDMSAIVSFHPDYPDWCYLEARDLYYPVAFLRLAKTKRQKLHEAVREMRWA